MAEDIEGLRDRLMPERLGLTKVTNTSNEQVLLAVRRQPRALGQPYSMWTYQRLADYRVEQTELRVSMKRCSRS